MIVKQTKCDNPKCDSVGEPECDTPYVPPYGWYKITVRIVGTGPDLRIETCSCTCIPKAIEYAERAYYDTMQSA